MIKGVKFGLSEKHSKFEKIFLMVLTNQLIYYRVYHIEMDETKGL